MSEPRVFIWSDQHFFHLNIIKYTKRPFAFSQEGLIEQAKVMLKNYQDVVHEQDLVLFLGDVAFTKRENRDDLHKLFAAMPGRKILLQGNHDTASDGYFKSLGFVRIYPYLICGDYFLCHYPLNDDPSCRHEAEAKQAFAQSHCTKIIHGHTHNIEPEFSDGIPRWNVCVDFGDNQYRPLLVTDPVLTHDLLALVGDIGLSTTPLQSTPLQSTSADQTKNGGGSAPTAQVSKAQSEQSKQFEQFEQSDHAQSDEVLAILSPQ